MLSLEHQISFEVTKVLMPSNIIQILTNMIFLCHSTSPPMKTTTKTVFITMVPPQTLPRDYSILQSSEIERQILVMVSKVEIDSVVNTVDHFWPWFPMHALVWCIVILLGARQDYCVNAAAGADYWRKATQPPAVVRQKVQEKRNEKSGKSGNHRRKKSPV